MAVILDTGPLYAYFDRDDQYHAASRALLEGTAEELVIPSPVLVEVDYSDASQGEPSRSLPRGRARSSALASGRELATGLSKRDAIRIAYETRLTAKYGRSSPRTLPD